MNFSTEEAEASAALDAVHVSVLEPVPASRGLTCSTSTQCESLPTSSDSTQTEEIGMLPYSTCLIHALMNFTSLIIYDELNNEIKSKQIDQGSQGPPLIKAQVLTLTMCIIGFEWHGCDRIQPICSLFPSVWQCQDIFAHKKYLSLCEQHIHKMEPL